MATNSSWSTTKTDDIDTLMTSNLIEFISELAYSNLIILSEVMVYFYVRTFFPLSCVCVFVSQKKKEWIIVSHCLRECIVCSITCLTLP